MQQALGNNDSCCIALNKLDDTSRYGRVMIDEANRVLSFKEKNANDKTPGYINSGIYLLQKNIIKQHQFKAVCSIETDIFPELLKAGQLKGFEHKAPFIDIGTPETLIQIEEFVDKYDLRIS